MLELKRKQGEIAAQCQVQIYWRCDIKTPFACSWLITLVHVNDIFWHYRPGTAKEVCFPPKNRTLLQFYQLYHCVTFWWGKVCTSAMNNKNFNFFSLSLQRHCFSGSANKWAKQWKWPKGICFEEKVAEFLHISHNVEAGRDHTDKQLEPSVTFGAC